MAAKITHKQTQKIIDLHNSGHNRTEIKAITGISLPVIRRVLRENGVVIEQKHVGTAYSGKQKEEILRRFKNGEIPKHIANDMGLNSSGVLKFLRRTYPEEAAPKWKTRSDISPFEFIRAWQSSENISDVVDKTGLPPSTIRGRAYLYRKRGIQLKKLQRSNCYDWEALANYSDLFLEEE